MNEKPFNLPRQKRKTFRRHFLTSVHAELGFIGVTTEKILAAEAQLSATFAKHQFLETRKVVMGSFVMQANSNEPAKLHQDARPVGLSFLSSTPRRELQVHGDKIVFSDNAYDGFESFLSRLREYSAVIAEIIGIDSITKIGLRKINSILIEPVVAYQDAFSIFNPALFAVARSGLVMADALKGAEDVNILERNGSMCILRARLKKMTSPSTYEANLDFDLVDRNVSTLSDAINKVFPELNDTHFDLFMWAATSDLIRLMEE